MCNVNQYGNLWIFKVVLPVAGMMKKGHKHEFDHVHYVVKGKGLIKCYSDMDCSNLMYEVEITEGKFYRVPKEHIHSITALEDGYIGHCIHAVRDENDEVLDTDMINEINVGKIEIIPEED